MIPVIGQTAVAPPKKSAGIFQADAASVANRPGGSSFSIGHLAKAAIAEAKAAGVEMPKNAQGKTASAIARGADPATLFQLRAEDTENPVEATDAAASTEIGNTAAREGTEDGYAGLPDYTEDTSTGLASIASAEYAKTSQFLALTDGLPEKLAVDLMA